MLSQLFAVSPEWSAYYLLVLARVGAALLVVPLFGAKGVPPHAKIGLSLLLSLVVLPLGTTPAKPIPTDLFRFSSLIGSEVLVGLAIGIATAMVLQALEMGASLVGLQIGFGMGEVLDPLSGLQMETLGQFYRLVATLIFFAVNGHHLVITGLVQTFQVVPAGSADLSLIAGDRIVPFFTSLFVVALRIALPVMGALTLTDVGLGLIARTVPQLNVLVVGFPLKIGVGLLVMAASLPLLTSFMGGVITSMLPQVNGLLAP